MRRFFDLDRVPLGADRGDARAFRPHHGEQRFWTLRSDDEPDRRWRRAELDVAHQLETLTQSPGLAAARPQVGAGQMILEGNADITVAHLRPTAVTASPQECCAFPYAEIELAENDDNRLSGIMLPDEDDRRVLTAAIAAEATVLCTANIKDFPNPVVAPSV